MDTVTRYTWKFRFVLLALAVAWGSFNNIDTTPTKAAKVRVEKTLTAEDGSNEAGKPAVRKVADTVPRRAAADAARPHTSRQPAGSGVKVVHTPLAGVR